MPSGKIIIAGGHGYESLTKPSKSYSNRRDVNWRRCDAPKPRGPYTQISCYDTPKFGSSTDYSSTYGIFVVAFLYIFLTNTPILIIFYKSLMYNSFALLHAKIYEN